jgi:hypothetical protein
MYRVERQAVYDGMRRRNISIEGAIKADEHID